MKSKRLNSTGKTVIIVTHDEKIAAACKRTIVISDGLIADPMACKTACSH